MAERKMDRKRASPQVKRDSEGRFASTNRSSASRISKSKESKPMKEHDETEELEE
ncbi:MAG TPA: hypothetical protein VFO76_13570 [Candidatus Kapabacteria bacterium]|nr:hypothetical protein [Candidatus Kapabacteria bacterium]